MERLLSALHSLKQMSSGEERGRQKERRGEERGQDGMYVHTGPSCVIELKVPLREGFHSLVKPRLKAFVIF